MWTLVEGRRHRSALLPLLTVSFRGVRTAVGPVPGASVPQRRRFWTLDSESGREFHLPDLVGRLFFVRQHGILHQDAQNNSSCSPCSRLYVTLFTCHSMWKKNGLGCK